MAKSFQSQYEHEEECRKCGKKFKAVGKYNKICPQCGRNNENVSPLAEVQRTHESGRYKSQRIKKEG